MSYTLSRSSTARQGSLLGTVIGIHISIVALVFTAKAVAPTIMETPLIVDLLPSDAPVQPETKAPTPVKSEPVRQKPIQKTPPLVAEQARSDFSLPASAQTPVIETAAVPNVPASEPPLSQARFDADYLRNPSPAYPPLARRNGEEGKVVLRVLVNPQGSADEVEIRTSSGSRRLDESAQKTVRTWRFIPAKRGELPVQSWVLVPIIFKLEQ